MFEFLKIDNTERDYERTYMDMLPAVRYFSKHMLEKKNQFLN